MRHSAPGSPGHRPGLARWPWRCAPGRARPRSARGRARRRSLAVLDSAGPRTRGRVTRARVGGGCRRRVGGHLRRNGRVCRSSARTAPAPHHQASGLQVAAGRLAPDPGRPLDAPQRPAEASQGEDLLSFVFSQDVAHAGQEHAVPDRRQRLGALSGMAGFQVSTNPDYSRRPRFGHERSVEGGGSRAEMDVRDSRPALPSPSTAGAA